MKKNFFAAFILILVGIAIILASADVSFPVSFFSIAIALAGLGIMVSSKRFNPACMTLLLVGLYMIARDLAPDTFKALSFWYIPGICFIALGADLLINPAKSRPRKTQSSTSGGQMDSSVIFSGETLSPQGEYSSGRLSAIFGGIELNLSGVTPQNGELTLNINAIFGGVEIYVPGSWKVNRDNARGIFGGIEIKGSEQAETDKILYIEGCAVFGGIDIIKLP